MSENRKRNFEDNKNFKGRKMRKKVCPFVKNGNFELDYKDAEAIKRFISEKGKILPRRVTGICAKHQRELTRVIKRARHAGVIAYTID
ncbi:MAG: 30S ribosomal protein S18 [Clostridiales bacterium]|jgi:ribosomal protein S18|nr:30S ribosomal protein S18 [Clostridiales bacterium]